jgi:hypothetical protein
MVALAVHGSTQEVELLSTVVLVVLPVELH